LSVAPFPPIRMPCHRFAAQTRGRASDRLMMENDGLAAHRRKHHNLGSAHWHLPVRLRVLPSSAISRFESYQAA
jgi:hypothetical protein